MIDRRHRNIPVTEDRRMEKPDELEVRTGFGSVKATGNMLVLLVVIMAGFAGLGYITVTTMAAHDKGGVDRFNLLVKEVTSMREGINEQTYVSTLSAEQKKALNLDMPDSLRRKMGRP